MSTPRKAEWRSAFLSSTRDADRATRSYTTLVSDSEYQPSPRTECLCSNTMRSNATLGFLISAHGGVNQRELG